MTNQAQKPSDVALSNRARWIFAILDVLTAALAGFLAHLVWGGGALLTSSLLLWAALQLASAFGIFVAKPHGITLARIAALYQLALLCTLVVGFFTSAAYLWGLYGQVGTGIAILLLVICALLVEVMGLLPIFKLRALGVPSRWRKFLGRAGLTMALLVPLGCTAIAHMVSYPSVTGSSPEVKEAMGRTALAAFGGPDFSAGDAVAPGEPRLYVVRAFQNGRQVHRVVARGNGQSVLEGARSSLASDGRKPLARRAVVIDEVVATMPLHETVPVLASLSIVPGIDGIGGTADGQDSVLLPQELIAQRLLTEETPLPFVSDFKVGVRMDRIRSRLCLAAGKNKKCHVEGLYRFRGQSWLTTAEGVTDLVRGRRVRTTERVTRDQALAGARAGGAYVVRSMKEDGRFTYKMLPLAGRTKDGAYSIPRHAGTTWFLLLLGRETGDATALRSAEKALGWLEQKIHPCGDRRCIGTGTTLSLGSQALPLIAFIDHARITGSNRFRPAIDALADTLLALQKPDGDFHFVWDHQKRSFETGRRHFYAAGQAALALSMLADLTGEERHVRAARAAMDFLAGPYWDFFGSDLFFVEEHWTCLAAREAWKLFEEPRHAELCVSIGSFYRKLQHRRSETVFADYVGGVGFSPFFPPHTTPTASRGEAMIAAYELSQKLGKGDENLREGIGDAIGFLLHNQFDEADTYGFPSAKDAVGGVPWNYLDPTIRIDTVQHAASVMLLGAAALPAE